MYFEKNWTLGGLIKKHRLVQNTTQARLAEKVSIPAQNINAFENGSRIPKIQAREDIAHALGTDPLELSDIDLSVEDEKRILNKLLFKYAKEMKVDENGGVTVSLDDDYCGLADKYNDFFRELRDSGLSGSNAINQFRNLPYDQSAIDNLRANKDFVYSLIDMSFWLDSWPKFDINHQYKKENHKWLSKKEFAIQLKKAYYEQLHEYSEKFKELDDFFYNRYKIKKTVPEYQEVYMLKDAMAEHLAEDNHIDLKTAEAIIDEFYKDEKQKKQVD